MKGTGGFLRSGLFRLCLVCLVVGIICIIFGLIELSDSKKTPIDINTMTKEDIEAGVIVEGDVYYNFGVCETIESQRNGRTESTSYRYVVPLSDDTLFTISLSDGNSDNKPLIDQLDKQTNETYDVLDGTAADTTTVVHIKGKISKMDSEDYGYYKDFLKSGDYTDDEIETYGSEYYLTVRDFGQSKIILIFGIVFTLIGAALGFVMIKGVKKAVPAAPARNFAGTQSAYPQQGMPQPGMPQQPAQFGQQQSPQQPIQFGQQQSPQQPIQFGQQQNPQQFGMNQQPIQSDQSGMPQPGENLQQPNDPFSV